MSATTTRPAWNRPGATTNPTLGAWNVTVRSASTTAPAISPVDASTPDGRSTETRPERRSRVHPLDLRSRFRPRLAPEPGAEQRVDDDVVALRRRPSRPPRARPRAGPAPRPARRRRSSRRRRRRRSAARPGTRPSPRARRRRRPAPSAPGSNRDSPGSAPPPTASRRPCTAARSRYSRGETTAIAAASSREWVIERSIAPAHARAPRTRRSDPRAARRASASRRSRPPST